MEYLELIEILENQPKRRRSFGKVLSFDRRSVFFAIETWLSEGKSKNKNLCLHQFRESLLGGTHEEIKNRIYVKAKKHNSFGFSERQSANANCVQQNWRFHLCYEKALVRKGNSSRPIVSLPHPKVEAQWSKIFAQFGRCKFP